MTGTAEDLAARRRRSLGPTYALFYEEPLELVRGKGVWLEDAGGRLYLDCYNNVPVVGHGHPAVVEAIARQGTQLNTHTRYLTEQPVALAERLLATMPDAIGNAVFTCSGSESNDLAVRLARTVTGHDGIIVTANAYHGTTGTLAGMSPSSRNPIGPNVFTVDLFGDDRDGSGFADRLTQCIAAMEAKGVRLAALMVDTIFSSDGVVDGPRGFLAEAAQVVGGAGGLFIADEVQAGFGRTGEAMWGFTRHGFIPDVVTMGKPMGNGHPVSALCARAELMAEFARHTRYFNTFGGSNVSCAAALAVLDVIEREGLIANSAAMGERMRDGIKAVAARHDQLGAIRGAGLFTGVDVAAGQGEAARIVNALRRNGVLISATAGGTVLKIRPPLPIKASEVDLFLERFDAVLEG